MSTVFVMIKFYVDTVFTIQQSASAIFKTCRYSDAKIKFVKLYFKKFCHTTAVGDRVILITYLNAEW